MNGILLNYLKKGQREGIVDWHTKNRQHDNRSKEKKMGIEADELIALTASCLDSQPDPL